MIKVFNNVRKYIQSSQRTSITDHRLNQNHISTIKRLKIQKPYFVCYCLLLVSWWFLNNIEYIQNQILYNQKSTVEYKANMHNDISHFSNTIPVPQIGIYYFHLFVDCLWSTNWNFETQCMRKSYDSIQKIMLFLWTITEQTGSKTHFLFRIWINVNKLK